MAMSRLMILIELMSGFISCRIFISSVNLHLTVIVVNEIGMKGCLSDGGSSFEASIVLVRILNACSRHIKMPYCCV